MTTLTSSAEDQSQPLATSDLDAEIGEDCPVSTQLALFGPPDVPKAVKRIARIGARKARRRRGVVDPTQPSLFPELP